MARNHKLNTWILAVLAASLLGALFAAPALATPLPGSSFDSQDGDQLTNTSPAALDWQNIAPEALLTTNLDNQAMDNCYTGGQETNPNSWTFGTVAGGCTPSKSDILGMWTHSELLNNTGILHAAFVRKAASGSSFLTFELNQKATTWTNAMGTTIPCRTNGDLLFSYELGGTVQVVMYRWTGDGSGPAACPNGANGTFQSSPALNNGLVNSTTITNYLSPAAITSGLGKAAGDTTVEAGLFGEAQIDIKGVLDSMMIGSCYSFVAAQAHSRTSQSISSALVDYVPQVSARVANCAVSGTVYSDANNNGTRDAGEGGAAGRTTYIDVNGNSSFDATEPSAITDAQGYYVIPTSLNSGTYQVRVVVPSGVYCTAPPGCSHSRTFTAVGTNSMDNNFGLYFPLPPANTSLPTISGTPQDGSTLTASTGSWTGHQPITYAYQWLSCDAAGANCSNIAGATSQTYAVAQADIGKTIRVRVTATNEAGSTSSQSSQTSVVTPRPPVNTVPPAISGTETEGSSLTAASGTWTGTPTITFAYQWLRCDTSGANCSSIASATNQSYALVGADIGFTIRVSVTGTNAAGNSSAQSSQTSVIAPRPPVNTGAPTVSGTAQEGSTLTGTNGTWTGTAPISFAYQWLRCDSAGASCSSIGGATSSTYSLVPADVGQTIRFRVTASNVGGGSPADSNQTAQVTARNPVNTALPTVSGATQAGSTLTAANGTWTGTAPINFTYQWLRCDTSGANCSGIAGATGSTHDVVPADVGSTIRVNVTGTNVGGDSSAQSTQTAVIGAVAPSSTVAPSVSGATQEASTLTAANGTWTGTAPITFTYQWLRCDSAGANCSNIASATNSTYDLVPADVGQTIRVRVTGTNVGGNSSAQSNQTAVVTARNPVNTALPTVSGTPQEASTLTAASGTWTGTAPISFAYQWLRCDTSGGNCSDIGGATNSTYDLVPADVGQTIRVRVTGSNVGGSSSAQSNQTSVVTARNPVNTAVPTVSGSIQDGQALTATNGTWAGTAPISFAYQWLRCDAAGANCSNIGGATSSTYTLAAVDEGSTIRVNVTGSNVGGSSSAQSAQTGTVGAELPSMGGPGTTPPSVSGNSQEGSTLTANPGTWAGTAPFTYAYQWLRCDNAGANCSNIASATSSTYDLVPADVGATIRVGVTATNGAGNAQAQSAQTAEVAARNPVNTALPQISGSTVDGQTLTAANGTWTGTAPITFTYQWLRCDTGGNNCSDINAATNSTYDLVPADVGSTIRVRVTGTNVGGNSSVQSAQAATITAEPPTTGGAGTTPPSISGNAEEGSTLTADPGTWDGTPPLDFTYQWQRCDSAGANCSDIGSATNSTYDLVPADVGSTIRVRVTATNGGGSASAQSAQTAVITAEPPTTGGAGTTPPSISGNPEEGSTLTADPGIWDGTPPLGFTYQWLRCDSAGANCSDISGATNSTYDLVPADVGASVRVRVTATNAAGSAQAQSEATDEVTAREPVNTVAPSISGAAQEASTLTAHDGTWSGTAPITFTYQWLRCETDGGNCSDISGATAGTYDLIPADVGSTIRVRVTGTNVGGSSAAESSQTGDVAARAPVNTELPQISGSTVDGQTLSTSDGTWTGTAPIDFTYQWQRCDSAGANCSDIGGATNSTYDLVPADVDSTIRVRVTATNAANTPVSAESNETATVTAEPPGTGGPGTTPPSVSGTAQDGSTLTADPGTWSGTAPFTFSYQWLRCDTDGSNCAAINGAIQSTYDLVSADFGSTIRVRVTATNTAGSAQAQSDETDEVAARLPINTGAPLVSGTPRDGETLTADPGTWDGTPQIDFTYQWLRCVADACSPIDGATEVTYVATAADVGSDVAVAVTATNAAGGATEDSGPVGPVTAAEPNVTADPSISGTPRDGETLTLDPGTWEGTGPFDFTYQWQRCTDQTTGCADINDAQAETHELDSSDVDAWIRVIVTATNSVGSQSATSPAIGPVEPGVPSVATAPSVSGTTADEETLTADPGVWDGTLPFDFEYQWQRCDGSDCEAIDGANDSTYVLTDADVGFDIRVTVTATNVAGSESATSPTVGPVTATQPGNTAVPSIGGTPRDGETLTADPGEWNGTGPFDYEYQWQRCDASGCTDIDGATDPTYELTDADVGFTIRVVVTATGPGGSETQSSEAMGPVEAQTPVNTSPPSIDGTPRHGETLTSDAGTWDGTGPLTTAYQWLRCQGTECDEINGANGETYEVGEGDVGYEIVLRVSVSNGAGSTSHESNRLGPVTAQSPSVGTPPSISGDPRDGGTLTADPGTWTGTGPIDTTYQWLRCNPGGQNCVEIPGATGPDYTPGPDDVGHTIRVDVTATGPGGSVTERSDPIGPIEATAPANLTPPTFGGALEIGSELTADPGTWSGTGPLDFAYQWLRCDAAGQNCVEIPGAHGESYVIGAGDVGSTIKVRVTASNDAGSATAETAAAGPVAAPPVDPEEDLSNLPGSLVNENRCQQAPRPVAASVAVRGIGRMRFRVAATDGIVTAANPLRAASVKTRVRRGLLNRLVRTVSYRLDRRPLRVVRRAPYTVSIPPARLAGSPRHTLSVMTVARSGRRSTVNIPFRTSPCTALFTANHRVIGRRGGLRLRMDTKYAIQSLAFRLPTAVIPRVRQRTSSGKLQLFLGGGTRPLYRLTFGTRSARNGTVLSRAGAPRVSIRGRRVSVVSLPGRVGIIKLELVKRGRMVRSLRKRTTLYAQVLTAAGKQNLRIRIGPKRR